MKYALDMQNSRGEGGGFPYTAADLILQVFRSKLRRKVGSRKLVQSPGEEQRPRENLETHGAMGILTVEAHLRIQLKAEKRRRFTAETKQTGRQGRKEGGGGATCNIHGGRDGGPGNKTLLRTSVAVWETYIPPEKVFSSTRYV